MQSKLPAEQECLLVQTLTNKQPENLSFEESSALFASKKEVVNKIRLNIL